MTKKQHRNFCKKLARFLHNNVKTDLNLLGVEAALMVNFGLSITNQTLLVIYDDYKKLRNF